MNKIEKLKQLIQYKKQLENDETITDEMYYLMTEKIDNEIANNYTIKEIDEVLESEGK